MARVPDMFFLSASGPEPVRSLQESLGSERILWTGRCAVAEYAFGEPASLPRWTLPEETGVVVTETRVVFIDSAGRTGGELHWLWPQHLRVQPGNRDTGRSATVTQIQLVCTGPGGVFPALVFAGGDLATVGDADRLANVLRQSIARFRVEHSGELGITAPQGRMLSRLVIGPEFNNYQGGQGQTVSLLGALAIEEPVGAGADPAAGPHGWERPPSPGEYPSQDAYATSPSDHATAHEGYAAAPGDYAGAEGDYVGSPASYAGSQGDYVASQAGYAESQAGYAGSQGDYAAAQAGYTGSQGDYAGSQGDYAGSMGGYTGSPGGFTVSAGGAGQHEPPAPAEFQPVPPQPMPAPHPLPPAQPMRAPEPEYSDLASRAADLAARVASLVSANAGAEQSLESYETQTTNLSSFLREGDPGYPAGDRAEAVRRTAARFVGNSARARTTGQRPVGDDHGTRQRNA